MQSRQRHTPVWLIAVGLASFACSNTNGGEPSPSPSVCEGCVSVLSDSSLMPAAVAADANSVYVLKSQTSEILAASLETKQSRVLSDSVPHAVSLFLRNQSLWVTAYDPNNDSLWTVDTATGATAPLPELTGLYAVALGPANTPIAALRANRSMRVVRLADDGAIASILWELDDTDDYFEDFAAGPTGVAWITSAPTAALLYFSSDMVAAPVPVKVRLAVVNTLTVANGTASVLASTDGGRSVFTLSGSQLIEQSPLTAQPMGMRALGDSLLVTSQIGRDVSALDSSGKLLSSKTLSRPLNIPATSDTRNVYLPLRDELAIFPRVESWL